MSIILDLLVVAVVALTAVLAARRGFTRTMIEVVGFFLAIYLSFALATPLAQSTYDGLLAPGITSTAERVIGDEIDLETLESTVDRVWDALPQPIVLAASNFGVTKTALLQEIRQVGDPDVGKMTDLVMSRLVEPTAVLFLKILFGILLFLVLLILVKILARLLGKLVRLPLVGTLDRTLGAVLGVVKGFIYAFALCSLLAAIAYAADGFLIFTPEAIAQSHLFRWLASINPFLTL